MAKHYGLTQKPGTGVTDSAPSWMESLFVDGGMKKTASTKKASPFEGVNDTFLNPNNHGVSKNKVECEICGRELKSSDIDMCEDCCK